MISSKKNTIKLLNESNILMGKVPLTQKFRDILTYQHQLNVDDTFYIQGDETSGIKTSTKQLQILPQTGSTQVLSPYGTNFRI